MTGKVSFHSHGALFEASGASDVVSVSLGGGATMLMLSGVAAENPGGRFGQANVAATDIDGQVEFVWRRIAELLDPHGATVEDIVKITCYTTDSRYLMGPVAASIGEVFSGGGRPACTGVVVSGLAWPELLVEIDVTAIVFAS